MRFWLLLVPLLASALEFKVATYNVENLFDAIQQGGEYEEYLPHNKHGWNQAMLNIKLSNITRVIRDMDADIIALEEVENQEVLEQLNRTLGTKKYPYLFFPKKKERVSVETALLSRFPIVTTHSYFLPDQPRGIHKITLKIDGKILDVFTNHWPAFKEKEDERVLCAKTLHQRLLDEKGREFIVLGDFNSPYEERSKAWGMGLVRYLGAGDSKAFLYNLWYELAPQKRFSHSYGKHKETLDHILIPASLKDGHLIQYRANTMRVVMEPYMMDAYGTPFRWQISHRGRGEHLGMGFSDHFPVMATFETRKE